MPYKTCPDCGLAAGARKIQCICGHVFGSKPASKKPTEKLSGFTQEESDAIRDRLNRPAKERFQNMVDRGAINEKGEVLLRTPSKEDHVLPRGVREALVSRSSDYLLSIHTPAGECPITLKGVSTEEVSEWANKVRRHFEEKRQNITNNALLYFSREFFPINTPEYKQVKSLLGLG